MKESKIREVTLEIIKFLSLILINSKSNILLNFILSSNELKEMI
jgi:hypothetical protein